MCRLKVANRRGSNEDSRFNNPAGDHGGGGGGGDDDDHQDESQEIELQLSHFRGPSNNPQTFGSESESLLSYSRAGELSAMVSALTRVVSGSGSGSGQQAGGQITTSSGFGHSVTAASSLTSSSSAGSGSGSGFWIGQKRGREEDSLAESVQRVYRGFGRGDSSSSGASAAMTTIATAVTPPPMPPSNTQMGSSVQSPLLSSSSSPSYLVGPPSSSGSSSSSTFPLLFGEQSFLTPPQSNTNQNQSSGSNFQVPPWTHSSHYPPSSGG
ncbi:hypothetical protein Patl1_08014 [Pistacia atlantica]|uniref:Uncharacterized protein n=1 Tax=Pistacia atlantica TaxID=434234 RepID=A0ACC1AJ92_9ROSI|nr:hypothetical protein Patl1_08014 [Pistacia atlantica]